MSKKGLLRVVSSPEGGTTALEVLLCGQVEVGRRPPRCGPSTIKLLLYILIPEGVHILLTKEERISMVQSSSWRTPEDCLSTCGSA
jgi:hypothetical protein